MCMEGLPFLEHLKDHTQESIVMQMVPILLQMFKEPRNYFCILRELSNEYHPRSEKETDLCTRK